MSAHGVGKDATASTERSHRAGPVVRILLEVLLIGAGVFLALMGEQWRERRDHAQLAVASLDHFRTEFQANRDAVAAVMDRHAASLESIRRYLNSDAEDRRRQGMPFNGTDPAFLEYSAWDLALATQSLGYIDLDLANAISHVYAIQRQLDDATRAITQVMYMKSGIDDLPSFLGSMVIYFGDCVLIEPRLLQAYDEILPRLDRVLGRPGA